MGASELKVGSFKRLYRYFMINLCKFEHLGSTMISSTTVQSTQPTGQHTCSILVMIKLKIVIILDACSACSNLLPQVIQPNVCH